MLSRIFQGENSWQAQYLEAQLRGHLPGDVINVASYKNGVGYGKWTHIDGWSEAVVEYIRELEQAKFD